MSDLPRQSGLIKARHVVSAEGAAIKVARIELTDAGNSLLAVNHPQGGKVTPPGGDSPFKMTVYHTATPDAPPKAAQDPEPAQPSDKLPVLLFVCGGRGYTNRARLAQAIDDVMRQYNVVMVLTGAANGADLLAEAIAKQLQLTYVGMPARWQQHGKSAGFIRNQAMLDYMLSVTDLMTPIAIACPGGAGTAHMVGLLRSGNIQVIELDS